MSEEKRSNVRWGALGALALAAIAAYALSRKTEPKLVADAGTPSVATQATVSLFDDGAPMAGRTVVFQAADGSVLETKASGADGKATGPMPSGGMITVAYGTSLKHLVTIVGVDPNDQVLVGESDNDEESTGDTSAIANIKLPGAYPRAARYGIELGVGTNSVLDAGVPLRLPVMKRFLDPKRRFQVLGLAYDEDGGALAYAHGEIAAAEAGDTDAKLVEWKTSWRSQRVRLLHPGGYKSVKVDYFANVGEARFDHRIVAPLHDPDTNLLIDVPEALGTNATYRVEASGDGHDRALVIGRDEKMSSIVLVDFAEFPRVSSAAVEKRRLSWKTDGDASKAHAVIMQVAWPETKEHVWTIVAPPTTKPGFQLPALPKELASWAPGESALMPAVALVQASEYASYADVKKKWIHMLGELPEENGSLRMSLTGDIDF